MNEEFGKPTNTFCTERLLALAKFEAKVQRRKDVDIGDLVIGLLKIEGRVAVEILNKLSINRRQLAEKICRKRSKKTAT